MMSGQPGAKRKRLMPRSRWQEQVENDIRSLGITKWKKEAENRDVWREIANEIKNVKTHTHLPEVNSPQNNELLMLLEEAEKFQRVECSALLLLLFVSNL